MIGRYEFEDLASKALSDSATHEDIENLAEWFENYGQDYWNGEKYSIDSAHDLCPVYTETEPGEYEITGWEIR